MRMKLTILFLFVSPFCFGQNIKQKQVDGLVDDLNSIKNSPANLVFFSTTGNNTTAQVGRMDKPYATPQAAVAAASAGQTIIGFPGTYAITGNLFKDGVNWFLYAGCEITNSTGTPTFDLDAAGANSATIGMTLRGGKFTNTDESKVFSIVLGNTNNILLDLQGFEYTSESLLAAHKCYGLAIGTDDVTTNYINARVVINAIGSTSDIALMCGINGNGSALLFGNYTSEFYTATEMAGNINFSGTSTSPNSGVGFTLAIGGNAKYTGSVNGSVFFQGTGGSTVDATVRGNLIFEENAAGHQFKGNVLGDTILFRQDAYFNTIHCIRQDDELTLINRGDENTVDFGGARAHIINEPLTATYGINVQNFSTALSSITNTKGLLRIQSVSEQRDDYGLSSFTVNGGKVILNADVSVDHPIALNGGILEVRKKVKVTNQTGEIDCINYYGGSLITNGAVFIPYTLGGKLGVGVNSDSTRNFKSYKAGFTAAGDTFTVSRKLKIRLTVNAPNLETGIQLNSTIVTINAANATRTKAQLADSLAIKINSDVADVTATASDTVVYVEANVAGTPFTHTSPDNVTDAVLRNNSIGITDIVGGGGIFDDDVAENFDPPPPYVPSGPQDINFETVINGLTESPANTWISDNTSANFEPAGKSNLYLPAGVTGRIYCEYASGAINAPFGFVTSNAIPGAYTSIPYGLDIGGDGNVYDVPGFSTPTAITVGDLVGIYRDGATGTIKLQRSTNSGASWTDLYTFGTTNTGNLYIVVFVGGSAVGSGTNKLVNPIGEGLE